MSSKNYIRSLSVILAATFISSQLFAAPICIDPSSDTLAPSVVSGVTNPARSEAVKAEMTQKYDELSSEKKPPVAPTLKFPGTPDLILGSTEYDDLIARISANFDRVVTRQELLRMRDIIQSKAPPTFFTEEEKNGLNKIADALTGQVSFQDLDIKIKSPFYRGKPLHAIMVNIIDLEGENSFRTNQDNFYQEVVTYDEPTGTLSINIPKAFFEEHFSAPESNAVTQTVLHSLLEIILGLSHQEAALALSFYNSDRTIAPRGMVTISDAHRASIEYAKKRAINGDKVTIRQLNSLFNSDYRFKLTDYDIQALKARGRSLDAVDTIRIHSEELARIINGMVRGPIGKFDTKISRDAITRPDVKAGKLPTQDVLNRYSLVANATVAAALAVVADGYRGKVSDLTEKAEIKIIKDGADGLAKEEIQVVFQLSGYRIIVTVSEGGLRDAIEKSFVGGEEIGTEGMEVVSIALDVIENTTATAEGKTGGTSIAVSAKGDNALLGNAPDVYAIAIIANVPEEKVAEFDKEPLEPGPYGDENSATELQANIKRQLQRVAEANSTGIDNIEVVLLGRARETNRLKAFKQIAVEDIYDREMQDNEAAIRDIIASGVFKSGEEIRGHIIKLLTLEFLKRCETYSKEFKMSDEDKAGLKALQDLTARDANLEDLAQSIDIMDQLGKGMSIKVLQDGTFVHGLHAALGRTEGKIKVFFGTSGAPEAFMNIALAKTFHKNGAIASMRLLSNAGLKKAKDLSPAYKFDDVEKNLIGTLRPEDADDIIAGKRLFTTADVKGEVEGAITFLTDNEVFDQEGVKLLNDRNTYRITTLRTSEEGGNGYAWVESRLVLVNPLKVDVNPEDVVRKKSAEEFIARASEDMTARSVDFKDNLLRILAENKEKLFFIGIENDIGKDQKAQMMPIWRAIDQIEGMTDQNGKRLFPNLTVKRATAGELVNEIQDMRSKGLLALDRVFLVTRKESVDAKMLEPVEGSWISAIDDSSSDDYLPVFEAITINMMAYLKADINKIKDLYDAISENPIDPAALQDMLKNRIIRILPKVTRFDSAELRRLYELAAQIYTAA